MSPHAADGPPPIAAGRLADLPVDVCVAVPDSDVALVRLQDDRICAFLNRCVHQDSPLTAGWVRESVLTCPLHFWRYRLPSGELVGGGLGDGLTLLDATIEGGQVFVSPPPRPTGTLREQLLRRAATYDRTTEYEERQRRRSQTGEEE